MAFNADVKVQKGYKLSLTSTVSAGYQQRAKIYMKLENDSEFSYISDVNGSSYFDYMAQDENATFRFTVESLNSDSSDGWIASELRATSYNSGLKTVIESDDSYHDGDFNDMVLTIELALDENYHGELNDDGAFQNGLTN